MTPHLLRTKEEEASEGKGLDQGDAGNVGHCWDQDLASLRTGELEVE